MPSHIPASERSRRSDFITEDQAQELRERRIILAKAKDGDEDALAFIRDEFSVRTWIAAGVTLIKDGILVAARVRS